MAEPRHTAGAPENRKVLETRSENNDRDRKRRTGVRPGKFDSPFRKSDIARLCRVGMPPIGIDPGWHQTDNEGAVVASLFVGFLHPV